MARGSRVAASTSRAIFRGAASRLKNSSSSAAAVSIVGQGLLRLPDLPQPQLARVGTLRGWWRLADGQAPALHLHWLGHRRVPALNLAHLPAPVLMAGGISTAPGLQVAASHAPPAQRSVTAGTQQHQVVGPGPVQAPAVLPFLSRCGDFGQRQDQSGEQQHRHRRHQAYARAADPQCPQRPQLVVQRQAAHVPDSTDQTGLGQQAPQPVGQVFEQPGRDGVATFALASQFQKPEQQIQPYHAAGGRQHGGEHAGRHRPPPSRRYHRSCLRQKSVPASRKNPRWTVPGPSSGLIWPRSSHSRVTSSISR